MSTVKKTAYALFSLPLAIVWASAVATAVCLPFAFVAAPFSYKDLPAEWEPSLAEDIAFGALAIPVAYLCFLFVRAAFGWARWWLTRV